MMRSRTRRAVTSKQVKSSASSSTKRSSNAETNPDSQPLLKLHDPKVWSTFHALQNEMIITKGGRNLFPLPIFSPLDMMQDDVLYTIGIEVVEVSDTRLRRSKGQNRWIGEEDEDVDTTPRPCGPVYVHPSSPQTGAEWRQTNVDFRAMKLTNVPLPPAGTPVPLPVGQFRVRSFHPYRLRVHVISESEGSDGADGKGKTTSRVHDFEVTTFVAVTHYQNREVNVLKKNMNPHAKGFKDSVVSYSANKISARALTSRADDEDSGEPSAVFSAPHDPESLVQAKAAAEAQARVPARPRKRVPKTAKNSRKSRRRGGYSSNESDEDGDESELSRDGMESESGEEDEEWGKSRRSGAKPWGAMKISKRAREEDTEKSSSLSEASTSESSQGEQEPRGFIAERRRRQATRNRSRAPSQESFTVRGIERRAKKSRVAKSPVAVVEQPEVTPKISKQEVVVPPTPKKTPIIKASVDRDVTAPSRVPKPQRVLHIQKSPISPPRVASAPVAGTSRSFQVFQPPQQRPHSASLRLDYPHFYGVDRSIASVVAVPSLASRIEPPGPFIGINEQSRSALEALADVCSLVLDGDGM